MQVMPRTHLGKWSVGLIVLFLLFFILLTILTASGQRGGATFTSNLLLAVPSLAAGFCAICAFVTGTIAVFHRKETAVLVFVSLAIGLAVTFFIIAEFAFPHQPPVTS